MSGSLTSVILKSMLLVLSQHWSLSRCSWSSLNNGSFKNQCCHFYINSKSHSLMPHSKNFVHCLAPHVTQILALWAESPHRGSCHCGMSLHTAICVVMGHSCGNFNKPYKISNEHQTHYIRLLREMFKKYLDPQSLIKQTQWNKNDHKQLFYDLP